MVSTPWARATATASSPAWPSSGLVRHGSLGKLQVSASSSPRLAGTTALVVAQRVDQDEQQVGADGGRRRAQRELQVERRRKACGVAGRQVAGRGRRARTGARAAASRAIQGSSTVERAPGRGAARASVAAASRSGSPVSNELLGRRAAAGRRCTSRSTVSSGAPRCGEPASAPIASAPWATACAQPLPGDPAAQVALARGTRSRSGRPTRGSCRPGAAAARCRGRCTRRGSAPRSCAGRRCRCPARRGRRAGRRPSRRRGRRAGRRRRRASIQVASVG